MTHGVGSSCRDVGGVVKPYIMDLESVNGTFVNGTRIDAARYTELREKDVLKLLGLMTFDVFWPHSSFRPAQKRAAGILRPHRNLLANQLRFGMSSRELVLLHGGSANHVAIDPKDLRSPSE